VLLRSPWRRQPDAGEARRLADELLAQGGIRRNRLAREPAVRDSERVRAARARALFLWADADRDGRLTMAEFARPLQGELTDGGGKLELALARLLGHSSSDAVALDL
jgi:hypothetical protein